jgi:hypothetical protein
MQRGWDPTTDARPLSLFVEVTHGMMHRMMPNALVRTHLTCGATNPLPWGMGRKRLLIFLVPVSTGRMLN